MKSTFISAIAALLGMALNANAAQVPPSFLKRAEDNYRAQMKARDFNGDGALTRREAHGNLLLTGRFDDIDVDRDGTITREELERFLSALPDHPEFR